MRRGQDPSERNDPDLGISKKELLDAADLSAKTFDTIRKAARVRGPNHGGLNWIFSINDVFAIIRRAESGNFTERGAPAAQAWRALLTDRGIEMPD